MQGRPYRGYPAPKQLLGYRLLLGRQRLQGRRAVGGAGGQTPGPAPLDRSAFTPGDALSSRGRPRRTAPGTGLGRAVGAARSVGVTAPVRSGAVPVLTGAAPSLRRSGAVAARAAAVTAPAGAPTGAFLARRSVVVAVAAAVRRPAIGASDQLGGDTGSVGPGRPHHLDAGRLGTGIGLGGLDREDVYPLHFEIGLGLEDVTRFRLRGQQGPVEHPLGFSGSGSPPGP